MKRLLSVILFTVLLSNLAYASASLQTTTTVNPEEVAPGEDGYVQLIITNVGTVPADNVKVRLASIDSPLKSATTFSNDGIGGLAVGKSVTAIFKFKVPEGTDEGFYNIAFTISSCENSYCRDTSQYAIVDVENPSTSFEISFESTVGGTSISVANVGINDVIAVSVTIPEQEQFEAVGTNTYFLGNLDSGDFTVADFDIISKNGDQGNLNVQISYTDRTGDRHTITKQVSIKLYEAPIQVNRGVSSYWWIVPVVIVVAVGLYFWKLRKKK